MMSKAAANDGGDEVESLRERMAVMFLRTAFPNRTRGSCLRIAVCAACVLALAAVNASAQRGGGGGGGGMCQGGGSGGGNGTTTGGTTTSGAMASIAAASFRGNSGLGTNGAALNPTTSVLQSMQAHSAQFRQAQLNALAANAQLRADTQTMWANARQRKQQALALRQKTVASRSIDP